VPAHAAAALRSAGLLKIQAAAAVRTRVCCGRGEEQRVRVLLTGIAGFAGSFLAEYLVQQPEVELHGVVHRHDRRIQHLLPQLTLHRGDLRNALWVSDLVQAVVPDITLHLAAWSDVGGSWQQPWTTYELNIQCQLNVLEALTRGAPMALQYWNSHRLPVLRARSFNHLGPGQSPEFAASAFARQIAEIEAGLRPPVVGVGNLDAQRDFTDVRDVVRAYWLLVTQGEPGECYNVGSGRPRPIRWLLDTLIELSPAQVQVELDPQRLRPSDVPCSYCDYLKLAAATGWQPQIDLRMTLLDLLNSWRDQIGRREA
jgi:GDP-4-dehydro-6-deoxy-D-mannose reductase